MSNSIYGTNGNPAYPTGASLPQYPQAPFNPYQQPFLPQQDQGWGKVLGGSLLGAGALTLGAYVANPNLFKFLKHGSQLIDDAGKFKNIERKVAKEVSHTAAKSDWGDAAEVALTAVLEASAILG